ncbi:MAG: ankyrin repeat domain-containing protein [Spirochaetes bacterium]|nr:ankyrin repeat domain-containing protein [Spirochaetota bacterium]
MRNARFLTVIIVLSFIFSFLNAQDSLIDALDKGDVRAIEQQLAKGADVNAKDVDGYTVFMYAAAFGNGDILKSIIAKGAETNTKANKGMSYFMALAACGLTNEMVPLIDKENVNAVRFDGRTALMYAAMNNQLQAVNMLVAKGASIAAEDSDGWTALMFTCANDKRASKRVSLGRFKVRTQAFVDAGLDIVKLLVSKGADAKAKTPDRFTTLMYASLNNNVAMAEYLIGKGVEVDALNDEDRTALMYAAMNNNVELVKLLLGKDADVNIRNTDDWNALMYACATDKQMLKADATARGKATSSLQNNIRTVTILLNSGADVFLRNRQGGTALMYAAANDNTAAIEMILAKAAASPARDALNLVVNAKNFDGWTALMYAAANENRDAAQLLLEKGADANAQNIDGWTPLMFAAFNGDRATIGSILSFFPNVNAESLHGQSALEYAVQQKHYEAAADLLAKNTIPPADFIRSQFDIGATNILKMITDGAFYKERYRFIKAKYGRVNDKILQKYALGIISEDDVLPLSKLGTLFESPYIDYWVYGAVNTDVIRCIIDVAHMTGGKTMTLTALVTQLMPTNADYDSLLGAFYRGAGMLLFDNRVRSTLTTKVQPGFGDTFTTMLKQRLVAVGDSRRARRDLYRANVIERIAYEYSGMISDTDIMKMRAEKRPMDIVALFSKKYPLLDTAVRGLVAAATNAIPLVEDREWRQCFLYDAALYVLGNSALSNTTPEAFQSALDAYRAYVRDEFALEELALDRIVRDVRRFGAAAGSYAMIRKSPHVNNPSYERILTDVGVYLMTNVRPKQIVDALISCVPAAGMTRAEVKLIAPTNAGAVKAMNSNTTNEIWVIDGRTFVQFSGDTVSAVKDR